MTNFSIGSKEQGNEVPSDFCEFINIVSGRSIVSGADWKRDRIEFGLSGDGMIRVFWTHRGLSVNFVSTTNPDEMPPLMLKISDGDKRMPARVLELRLRALRNLYALVHLTNTQRLQQAVDLLQNDPNADLEELLTQEEQLYIECLAPGSWYVTVWSALRSSYKSILETMAIVCVRGREAFLSKIEAEARLKQLDVEAKEFEIITRKVNYTLGLMDRLNTDPAKAVLKTRVETELTRFLLKDSNSSEVIEATKRLL